MADVEPNSDEESPHDVLAAEMYAMPAPDPGINDPAKQPHDVLAAEMYAMPAPDPTIHHPPVVLPEDLTGVAEPVDVLAAEEFAMPAPPSHPDAGDGGWSSRGSTLRPWALLAIAAIAILLVRRAAQRAAE